MGALPITTLSVEEYLALDRVAEVPSEYHDGELFPIEAVTVAHSLICINIGSWLKSKLSNTACHVVGSPLRVRVTPTKYVIPDLMVFCGKPELADEYRDTVTNPKLILEVLSPSTADYDYGGKLMLYRRLPSFEEYVLVAQDRPRIEIFRKAAENRWVLITYEGLEAAAAIESLDLSLPLKEVYEDVELPPATVD